MKLKSLLITFSLLFSSLALFPIPVSARYWTSFGYTDFSKGPLEADMVWRAMDRDYIGYWQAKIYDHLEYNPSYSGNYGVEVGFYSDSNRMKAVGIQVSFGKRGEWINVYWWNGNEFPTELENEPWNVRETVVITIRQGRLNVGSEANPESLVKDFPSGAWVMNQIGVKGDIGLTLSGTIGVKLDFLLKEGNWKYLNTDPLFHHPEKDPLYYNPHMFKEGAKNDSLIFWNITFSNGSMRMKISNFNDGSEGFAHIAAGAFHGVWLGWNFFDSEDGTISRNFRIRVEARIKVTKVLEKAIWLRAGVAIAVFVPEKSRVSGRLDRFVELDFFRKNVFDIQHSDIAVVVPYINVSMNEVTTLNMDMTEALERYLGYVSSSPRDYRVWGVYLVIEAINAEMNLEVYDFHVLYAPREEPPPSPFPNLVYALIATAVGSVVTMIYYAIKKKRRNFGAVGK